MKIDTAEIKKRVSLRELMLRDGHKLVMMGGLEKCICPFHKEKSPSCCVYTDGHLYCFGCHASGDVIGYTMKFHNLSFKQAVEKLGGSNWTTFFDPKPYERFIPNRETPPLSGAKEMMNKWFDETCTAHVSILADSLGVSLDSLHSIGCVWASEYRAWAFPMKDFRTNIIGIRLRDENGKKWAVKGSKEGLFFADVTSLRGGGKYSSTAYLCEGPTDCAAGITLDLNMIGRPSCNGAVKELVKRIEFGEYREVIIISDNDAPGLAGSERLQSHLNIPYRELVLPCKDLREFLKLGGTKQLLESMAAKQMPQRRPKK